MKTAPFFRIRTLSRQETFHLLAVHSNARPNETKQYSRLSHESRIGFRTVEKFVNFEAFTVTDTALELHAKWKEPSRDMPTVNLMERSHGRVGNEELTVRGGSASVVYTDYLMSSSSHPLYMTVTD